MKVRRKHRGSVMPACRDNYKRNGTCSGLSHNLQSLQTSAELHYAEILRRARQFMEPGLNEVKPGFRWRSTQAP